MARPADRYPLIDGLRAVAALGVLLTHTAVSSGFATGGGAAARVSQRLEVGVAVFFVISGFVLYRPFLLARGEGGLPRLGAYARRRALRIVPAYWLVLTVAAVALGLHEVFTPRGVLAYYGFGQIYSDELRPGGLVQAWTLDVEVTFYLFLPLWAWLLRRASGRTDAYALVGLALFSLAWKAAFAWAGPPDEVEVSAWQIALPAYLDHFALGMGIALWSVSDRRAPQWLPAAGVGAAVAALAVASLGIGLGRELFEPYTRWQFLGRHELYAVVGAGLVLAAVASPRESALGRLLANPLARWLGAVSYGVYLWQMPVVDGLDRLGFQAAVKDHRFIALSVVVLAVTTLLAAASWYLLERPVLRAGSLPWRTRSRVPRAGSPPA